MAVTGINLVRALVLVLATPLVHTMLSLVSPADINLYNTAVGQNDVPPTTCARLHV